MKVECLDCSNVFEDYELMEVEDNIWECPCCQCQGGSDKFWNYEEG